MKCVECSGSGRVEVDDPRPHAGGFNVGWIDSVVVECEDCGGSGEVESVCPSCGYELGVSDVSVCVSCQGESDE